MHLKDSLFNQQLDGDVCQSPIIAPKKNNRIVWNNEMHERFLHALCILGDDASPSKILRKMNVRGLTRLQVSSHYQKHRKTIKRAIFNFSLEEASDMKSPSSGEEEEKVILDRYINAKLISELKSFDQCTGMLSTSCGNISTSYLPLSGFCSSV